MEFDKQLDVRGLSGPMQIVETKKALAGMADVQQLKVAATDTGPASEV